MARPKTYLREEALRSACEAFWKFGYERLGVRALEEETKINQFALQNDFGGKENLFLEALQLYVDETEKNLLKPIREGCIDQIEFCFESLANPKTQATSKWGCMVVNAGVDNASLNNPKISEISVNYWLLLESAFYKALKSSQRHNDIGQDVNLRQSAKALVVAAMGIHASNRINNSLTAGNPLAEVMCSTISSWRVG